MKPNKKHRNPIKNTENYKKHNKITQQSNTNTVFHLVHLIRKLIRMKNPTFETVGLFEGQNKTFQLLETIFWFGNHENSGNFLRISLKSCFSGAGEII